METTLKREKNSKKRKAQAWFKNRIGKNIFRRIYNSITGQCVRQYFRIESMSHAFSLYASQDNGFRYDEN